MTYIDNMTESERYIYGFLVAGANEYIEDADADTTDLTFRIVANCVEDDYSDLVIIKQHRCGSAWSYSVDAYTSYWDEPDAVEVCGWRGEHVCHKVYASSTWQSFKDMACIVADLMYERDMYDGEIELGEWRHAA